MENQLATGLSSLWPPPLPFSQREGEHKSLLTRSVGSWDRKEKTCQHVPCFPSYHLFNSTPAGNQCLCCALQRAKLSRAYCTINSEEEALKRRPGHPRNVGDRYLGCCSGRPVVSAQHPGLLLVWVGLTPHWALRLGMAKDWPATCSHRPVVTD